MTVVVLNPDLTETPLTEWQKRPKTFEEYYEGSARKKLKVGHYRDKVNFTKTFEVPNGLEREISFLGMLSDGYSRHVPIAIAPHDFWFILMTELAQVIEDNVEPLRPLFSRSSEKVEIAINVADPTDLTGNMHLFEEELRKLVPVDVSVYVPEFSTHSAESRRATMGAFMVYYSYSMLCCGLPSIKILGTVHDWKLFRLNLGQIGEQFGRCNVKVDAWFDRVKAIVDNVIATLEGEDKTEWWKGIFTQRNIGSGGEQQVNGWFTGLYKAGKSDKLDNFGTAWAAVPFKNLHEPNVKYTSIHGVLMRERDADGFLNARYNDFTVVHEPATEEEKNAPLKFEVTRVTVG